MDQLGNLVARPRLYYNIDGLGEVGVGVMFLGTAFLVWLPANSVWHRIFWFILLGLALAIRHGIRAIKLYMTYPRTGFVEYQRTRWRTSIIEALAGALIPIGFIIAVRYHWHMTSPFSLAGLSLAGAYAYGVARAVRWKWAVASAIALGSIVIAFLPADVLAALAHESLLTHPVRAKLGGTLVVSLMTYGLMLVISGGITLWLYLRHTQAPPQEGQ